MHESLGVFDDVFASFLESNIHLGRLMSLEYILTEQVHPRRFRYEYKNVPYSGTIETKHSYDATWIEIKLYCNEFEWPVFCPNEMAVATHPRRGEGDWYVISELESLPGLARALDPDAIAIYYAENAYRMDMKFFYDAAERPNVMVTFELGYAVFDKENDTQFTARVKP
jgi:hypothetical protein